MKGTGLPQPRARSPRRKSLWLPSLLALGLTLVFLAADPEAMKGFLQIHHLLDRVLRPMARAMFFMALGLVLAMMIEALGNRRGVERYGFALPMDESRAMVLIDCVARLLPGALGNEESAVNESFSNGLIEHPHYTRPAELRGEAVPEVLLSGHHANIETWRRERSLELTKALRPELLNGIELSKKDKAFIDGLDSVEDN